MLGDMHGGERSAVASAARGPSSSAGDPLLGLDGGLRALASVLDRVAAAEATVLLRGETGTGKEMVAREIHARSPRSQRAFVRTSCAALAEGVLESELFGHEAGAFTGARGARAGRFEEAHGGTLFLDEIGDVSVRVQVALLRVLQEHEFQRVGSNRTLRVDVRVIAATHASLEAKVRAHEFREDLFYRLNVVPLYLPPLRDRREDVPGLARHFAAEFGHRLGKQLSLTEAALERLSGHGWPGNVRQLRNVVEHACVLADRVARIDAGDLELGSDALQLPEVPLKSCRAVLEEVEREEGRRMLAALREARGSKTRAAQILGIPRTTLTDRLRRLEPGGASPEGSADGEGDGRPS
jgi:transcriptional regulator with GAF, ATPase, and Fis domain